MTRIAVLKFGDVKDHQVESILDIMNETYERLQPHEVEIVDALFFQNNSLFRDFLTREKMCYGVSEDFDSDFPAIHDAWRGIPRISLCIDELNKLSDLVAMGTIRHEVGHSILHGSLEYYIFQTPHALSRMEEKYQLTPQFTRDILYLIAIAVKDCEVTDLLYSCGYDDQVAYAETLIESSKSDVLAWRIASGNPSAEILCIAGRLKDLMCVAPIINSPNETIVRLNKHIESGLSYIPQELSKKVIEIALRLSESVKKASTHKKIEKALNILCDELFDQILNRSSQV